MEGRALIQYLIDTSDVVLAKKQEATEYLAKLESAAKQGLQADGSYWACEKCNSIVSVKFNLCGLCNSPRR